MLTIQYPKQLEANRNEYSNRHCGTRHISIIFLNLCLKLEVFHNYNPKLCGVLLNIATKKS